MTTIMVEITASDVSDVGSVCTGACVAGYALRRIGLIGDVKPDRIRLYGRAPDVWREVDTPGQLRRFMRLFDSGVKVPPPTVAIELPEDWQDSEPDPHAVRA